MITEQLAKDEINSIVAILSAAGIDCDSMKFSFEDLAPQAKGRVLFGQARSGSRVVLTTAYFKTSYLNCFRETVIHEIAHHVAGFSNNHNRVFKDWLNYFKRLIKLDGRAADQEAQQMVKSLIKPRSMKLYAKLINGEDVYVQSVYSRHARYTKYNKHVDNLKIRGIQIDSFYYVNV